MKDLVREFMNYMGHRKTMRSCFLPAFVTVLATKGITAVKTG